MCTGQKLRRSWLRFRLHGLELCEEPMKCQARLPRKHNVSERLQPTLLVWELGWAQPLMDFGLRLYIPQCMALCSGRCGRQELELRPHSTAFLHRHEESSLPVHLSAVGNATAIAAQILREDCYHACSAMFSSQLRNTSHEGWIGQQHPLVFSWAPLQKALALACTPTCFPVVVAQ